MSIRPQQFHPAVRLFAEYDKAGKAPVCGNYGPTYRVGGIVDNRNTPQARGDALLAAVRDARPGSVIELLPGEHVVGSGPYGGIQELTLPPNVSLVGKGCGVTTITMMEHDGHANPLKLTDGNMLHGLTVRVVKHEGSELVNGSGPAILHNVEERQTASARAIDVEVFSDGYGWAASGDGEHTWDFWNVRDRSTLGPVSSSVLHNNSKFEFHLSPGFVIRDGKLCRE